MEKDNQVVNFNRPLGGIAAFTADENKLADFLASIEAEEIVEKMWASHSVEEIAWVLFDKSGHYISNRWVWSIRQRIKRWVGEGMRS